VKSFTERDPRAIGVVALVVAAAIMLGVLVLNRSVFVPTYTVHARFPDAAGIGKGAPVTVAGVRVGAVTGVHIDGDAVMADMAINHGVVLPHQTSAAIEVQTVLGVLDVSLTPERGWSQPLGDGATITRTSVPVEFQDLQNSAGNLLRQSDVQAFNRMLTSLRAITQGKQTQVAEIVDGLGRFTAAIDARRAQVGNLIDSANALAGTVSQHDQQLGALVDDLTSVVQGLAQHSTQLATLIANTEAVAAQTASLVGQNQPALQGLLSHLTSVLAVVQQHQLDLAQGVSYLASAVTGFASIGYSGPNDAPQSWGNIYANLLGSAGAYGALGNCAALDTALDGVLGPDPTPCDQRTGPPVGSPSATPSGGPSSASTPSSSGTAASAGSAGSPGRATPSATVNPLTQLLAPLLGSVP
jgi:phospholipid/cholesterol/gamma-HCH transport system substrate-binding protein